MKISPGSLHAKFVIKLILFLLVPLTFIISFLTYQVNRFSEENLQIVNSGIREQALSDVEQRFRLAEDLASTIVDNQQLLTFLGKPYVRKTDLEYYNDTMYNYVRVSTGFSSDFKLRIYMENDTVPPGFGIFYSLDDIRSVPEFMQFYEDESARELWADGNRFSAPSGYHQMSVTNNYCYLMKVEQGGQKLGAIIVTIPKSTFAGGNRFFTAAPNGMDTLVYNYISYAPDPAAISNLKSGATASFGTGVYQCCQPGGYPLLLVTVTPREDSSFLILLFIGIFLLFFGVSILLFIRFINGILRDINTCLDGMNESIQNQFSTEVQISGSNEVAHVADRINYLIHRIRRLIDKTVRQQVAAKESQLVALQHQINPHFLYNTMEIFSSKMELNGLYAESEAMASFCNIMRYNLGSNSMLVRLEEEFEQVEHYIAIQKLRSIHLDLRLEASPEVRRLPIIKFILQPFVENSVKYRDPESPLQITVSARLEEEEVRITVTDNGLGMSALQVKKLNHAFHTPQTRIAHSENSIGLFNINQRLILFYGPSSALTAQSQTGRTSFTFRVSPEAPIRRPFPPG